MINLLPPHGQTALKHEYVLRVVTLYGFLLGGVCLAAAALLIPSYVLTGSQLESALNESSGVEETRAAFDAAFEEIRIANTIMAQLQAKAGVSDASMIIEEIVRVAPAGVAFTTFQLTNMMDATGEIQVQGEARNRNALADFKDALEASALFETAVIPISDLARDADLPFVITIVRSVPSEQTDTTS